MLWPLLCFSFYSSAQLRQVYIDGNEDNDLRKISFYNSSSGYVAFRDWIGYTTDSGRTFTKKYVTLSNVNFNGYTANVTFGFGIKGVKAFSQDTVIAYGDYGFVPSILYSTDGGNNFKLVFHSQFSPSTLRTGITDMVFPQNGSIGWAIDADRFLKTTDKGLTWTTYALDPGRYYNYIEAVDNNLVFFISETKVWRTPNGGTSWNLLGIPAAGTINYAQFINSSKGWINIETVNGGVLYYTSNSGSSWTAKTDLSIEPFSCIKMKFRNDSVGYAVVEDHYYTYKTSDSGRIWERLPRDNNFSYLYYNHEDIHFRTDDQFWVGGDYGLLELTTNAGGTPLPSARFKIDTTSVYSTNTVKLLNYSKPGYQYNWYLNNSFIGSTYNSSYTHDIYRPFDTIKLIITNGVHNDTSIKVQAFNAVPYPPPVVSSFTPGTGGTGTVVLITGNFFVNVTAVSIGGIPVSSYSILSINQISAIVGAGANGAVSVTTIKGTGSSPGYIFYPPPIISSFSPLAANVGSPITINGSNFSTVPGNNIVYFGGIKAQIQSATSTQLIVTVPPGAGYSPISVTVNNHIGYSAAWFKVTFPSTCGFSEFTFEPRKTFPLTDGSTYTEGSTAIVDFDGDGKNDVVSTTTRGFSIVRNTGGPGNIDFATQEYYYTGPLATGLGAADLDGDGKQDIVVSSTNSDTISFFRNTSIVGAITFATKINLLTADAPQYLSLSDLDLDGKPDLIMIVSGKMAIYRNISLNGNINFASPQYFAVGLYAQKPMMGDMDGDAKPDIVLVDGGINNSGLNTFTVYRNTSSIGIISFAPYQVFNHWTYSYQDGGLADVDGDGKLDIGIVYDVSYTIGQPPSTAIYKNTSTPGNISLAPPVAFTGCYYYSRWVAFGDLDGDSKPDIFEACMGSGNVVLFRNTTSVTNISMTSMYPSSIWMSTGRVSIGDVDGDGKADLVVTGNGSGGVNVYRNILNERGAWAGKDTTICNGQTIRLGKQQQVLSSVLPTYSWTSNPVGFTSTSSNPIVNPTINTVYYLAATDPSGCIHYDTVRVNVGVAPTTVDAGTNKVICIGSTAQIGTPAIGSYTYSWSSAPTGYNSTVANPMVIPNTTTTYFLSVNSGTCIAKDTVIVTVNPFPIADAGPDRFICPPNGTAIGIAGSGNNVYSWTSDPTGYTSTLANPIVFPSATTTYFLKVTLNGCSSYDTVLVTALPIPPTPIVIASGPLSFCTGGSVTLTSSIASPIQWQNGAAIIPGATNQTLVVTQSGTYFAVTTLGTCKTSSAGTTVTVSSIPTTPSITAGGTLSFCDGSSVVLTSSANSGNQWYKDGIAISGAVNKTYTATQTGSYTVKVIVNNCSSAISNAIVVTVNPVPTAPVISGSDSIAFCAGGSVVLSSSAGSSYQWYRNSVAISGATNPTYIVTQAGSYTVKVTVNGCVSPFSNAIVVSVESTVPVIMALDSLSFCNGDSVILTSSSTSGNQWYKDSVAINGAVNQRYTAMQTGNYYVKVTNTNCPTTTSNTLNVFVGSAGVSPTITAGGPVSICDSDSVVLTSSASLGNRWYKNGVLINGAVSQNYTATTSGSYTANVVAGGCTSAISNAIVVIVSSRPLTPVITAGGPITFCNGNSVLLTSSANSGNQWYKDGVAINSATNQTYTATQPGNYSVKVTVSGCSSLASNTISVTINQNPQTPVITQTGDTLRSSATTGNQWYLNGSIITGATGVIYKPVVSGIYTVIVTTNNCQSNISNVINYVVTAIVSPSFDRFISISPNPTNDIVFIKYSGNFGRFSVSVSDMSGKTLFANDIFTTSYTLNLKKYSSGPYIINILNTKSGERIHRIIMKL